MGSRKSRSEKELGNLAHKEHKDTSLHAFTAPPPIYGFGIPFSRHTGVRCLGCVANVKYKVSRDKRGQLEIGSSR